MKINTMLDNVLVVAVDFDGTITNEPSISDTRPTLRPHCKEVLEKFYDHGIKLILWTSRTDKAYDDAVRFLAEEEIAWVFDKFNDSLDKIQAKYGVNSRKVGADIYIDDKNIFCTHIDWLEIERWVLSAQI